MKKLYLTSDYSENPEHPRKGQVFKILDYEYDDSNPGHIYSYLCESLGDGKFYVLYPDEVEEFIE